MKVALVHDWLVSSGGGERVLYDFHVLFPDAPIYTLVYDAEKAPQWLKECDVRTTYIQKIPFASKLYKNMLTLMPGAWERLDLTEYDLVLNCNYSCSKGVITRPDAVHICYCCSPTRYLWDMYYTYLDRAGAFKRFLMPFLTHKVRTWDRLAADRVDYFLSDSDFVGSRIVKYYRRDFKTIYPGVQINNYPITEQPDDYYLVVSRFVYYKRVDLAVEACTRLGKRLVVIGKGDEAKKLRALAGDTVEFKGFVTDEEMQQYYSKAKAFLFPGKEDFGITPVEAESAGVPVLAYGEGGALETVLDGKTGKFFYEQTVEGMMKCIEDFEKEGVAYTRRQIHDYSLSFSEERFRKEIKEFCEEKMCCHE